MSITVHPLHPVFGAEMKGADLTAETTPELVEAVGGALADGGLARPNPAGDRRAPGGGDAPRHRADALSRGADA